MSASASPAAVAHCRTHSTVSPFHWAALTGLWRAWNALPFFHQQVSGPYKFLQLPYIPYTLHMHENCRELGSYRQRQKLPSMLEGLTIQLRSYPTPIITVPHQPLQAPSMIFDITSQSVKDQRHRQRQPNNENETLTVQGMRRSTWYPSLSTSLLLQGACLGPKG